MHDTLRLLLLIAAFSAMLTGCTQTGDSAGSAADLLSGSGIALSDFEELAGPSASELSASSIVGTWIFDEGGESFTKTFSADGTGNDEMSGSDFDWGLDGNVMTVAWSDEYEDEGLLVTVNDIRFGTSAVVDDRLYEEVFIRVEGTGNSPAGIWKNADGRSSTHEIGDTITRNTFFSMKTLTIEGNSFSLAQHTEEEWETTGDTADDVNPDDDGSQINDDVDLGSVEIQGEFLVVYADSNPDLLTYVFARLSDDILVSISGFPPGRPLELPAFEDALASVSLARQ